MIRSGRVAAILLAAGESARFGRPKQLLPFRGRTLLRHAAQTALGASFEGVYVVLGAAYDRTAPELDALPVRVVRNLDWHEGMGSSIRCGVHTVLQDPTPPEGVMLLLADQPMITSAHLSSLVSLFRRGDTLIVAAHFDGHPGAPAVFGAEIFPDLLELQGAHGARHLISSRCNEASLIDLPEAALDIDVEADYRTLLAAHPSREG